MSYTVWYNDSYNASGNNTMHDATFEGGMMATVNTNSPKQVTTAICHSTTIYESRKEQNKSHYHIKLLYGYQDHIPMCMYIH